ncbi:MULTISPECIES: Gx transporter family protein [unclassified Enterococcus]|uniref:Gx transporter family protein n=1 Tax=unclassified Enterococcus TaxID=2608891 RepID=UPI001553CBE2|nr:MULTISPECIES: Gx transporter family protein [unclassified Enterococcus]MBS7577187.1 Gx transporter family protein [Enterococcus sp. MMGLQ5-2]MBS7584720.1 Gx transporter family protein [Enterococcus sp. MMGLQ5-1]NPD12575.1 Gx transporter family protein [Enterococcus sp. MMGLQ5-1]NPD37021.1 Gx transporter family protein [Enterococcus sp. MMGLQ5-2]
MDRLKILLYTAILAAIATVISVIEGMFPPIFAFAPGAKLGLANLVTVVCLFSLPKRNTVLLLITRLLVSTLLLGGASTFLYSFAGTTLSYLAMLLVKQLGPKRVSVIGISSIGGFFHNVGQLAVASLIAQTWSVMLYLPVLSILGIMAGILNGIAGNFLLTRIKQLKKMNLIFHANSSWLK